MPVFRDRWLLVVDKPSGVPTQTGRDGKPGLFEQHRATEEELYLHHRLDQPASGLVLFSRDSKVNKAITDALRSHSIQRIYRAVLYGSAESGTWNAPVQGKKARTDVAVVGTGSGLTAAELRLHTGRKHQIRVQAAMAGAPVIGDRRYGGDAGRAWPRLALHAWRMAWTHPITGEPLEWEVPLPENLAVLWERAGGR